MTDKEKQEQQKYIQEAIAQGIAEGLRRAEIARREEERERAERKAYWEAKCWKNGW